MKRLALVMAALLLAAPAQAQFSAGGGDSGGTRTRYTEEEKRNEALNERAYRDAIRNTRGETSETYDPWRNIRQATPDNKKPPQR